MHSEARDILREAFKSVIRQDLARRTGLLEMDAEQSLRANVPNPNKLPVEGIGQESGFLFGYDALNSEAILG